MVERIGSYLGTSFPLFHAASSPAATRWVWGTQSYSILTPLLWWIKNIQWVPSSTSSLLISTCLSSPFRCQYCKTLVSLENDRDCSSFYLASFLLLSLDAMALNTTAIMVGDIYRNTDTPTDGPSPCQLCRELWKQDKVERMISLAKLFTHVQNYLI